MPRLEIVPPAKIAKLLRTREGSHVFFAEVSAMAKAVRRTLEHDSPKVRRAGEAVLNPTSLKIGRRVDPDALAASCGAENIIAAVVAPEALESGESDENVDGDENESIDATVKTRIGVVPSNRVAKEEEEEGEAEEEEEEEMGRDDETTQRNGFGLGGFGLRRLVRGRPASGPARASSIFASERTLARSRASRSRARGDGDGGGGGENSRSPSRRISRRS